MVVKIFKNTPTQSENIFKDVKETDWFYDIVNYAAEEGLIKGYDDGRFLPQNNL
ncbi:MAG: S-layer homology domain-containing protein, partial [Clostridium sp.]|nr:S-layer homology domain-containing protein [Clostridium sp.]